MMSAWEKRGGGEEDDVVVANPFAEGDMDEGGEEEEAPESETEGEEDE